jgi:hypothetical protein
LLVATGGIDVANHEAVIVGVDDLQDGAPRYLSGNPSCEPDARDAVHAAYRTTADVVLQRT